MFLLKGIAKFYYEILTRFEDIYNIQTKVHRMDTFPRERMHRMSDFLEFIYLFIYLFIYSTEEKTKASGIKIKVKNEMKLIC